MSGVYKTMEIKFFKDKYRDDMIFMVLQAKDALGLIPRLNDDLIDIKTNYFDRGDKFLVAVDDNDRVVGCCGYSRIEGTNEAFIHRLYVKASEKHKGIGSALLEAIEDEMRKSGIVLARIHLGSPREQWFESYSFYTKHEYVEYEPRYMMKRL